MDTTIDELVSEASHCSLPVMTAGNFTQQQYAPQFNYKLPWFDPTNVTHEDKTSDSLDVTKHVLLGSVYRATAEGPQDMTQTMCLQHAEIQSRQINFELAVSAWWIISFSGQDMLLSICRYGCLMYQPSRYVIP